MARYEFNCLSCGRRCEQELVPGRAEPACPHCYGPLQRVYHPTARPSDRCELRREREGKLTIALPTGEVLHVSAHGAGAGAPGREGLGEPPGEAGPGQ